MVLGIHLLVTLARLLRPGGVRAVAAESLILKHQLVILGRSRRRAPNLTSFDCVVLGIAALFVSKLDEFRTHYNTQCVHRALDGVTPICRAGNPPPIRAVLANYRWQSHCRGLFQTPQHA